MWNKLSYEYKTYVLMGAMVLVTIIGYQTSISKTLESFEENSRLKNVEKSTSIAEFSQLQKSYNDLDSTFKVISSIDYDKLLIAEISDLLGKYDIEIAELQNEKIGKTEIDVLTLEGSFKELLQSIYYFEQSFYVGKVFSTDFHLVKDQQKKTTKLYLDIYLQRMESDYSK